MVQQRCVDAVESCELHRHKSAVSSTRMDSLGVELDFKRCCRTTRGCWMVLMAGLRHALDRRPCCLVVGGSNLALHIRGHAAAWESSVLCAEGADLERSSSRITVLQRPLCARHLLSDASLTGYGVRMAHCLRDKVNWEDQASGSRFKLKAFCRAWESALFFSASETGLDNGGWTLEDSATELGDRWAGDPSFQEIPAAVAEEKWRRTDSGLWQHSSDVMLLGGWCASATRRKAVNRHGCHTRTLFFGVEMSVVMSLSRARSSSF